MEIHAATEFLLREDCPHRRELEEALATCANEPPEWETLLTDFASSPSEERWKELMQFVPEDDFYQRLRNTIGVLMRLGCNGNILFTCVTRTGMVSDVFDLVSGGTVDPEVIEARGNGSPARAMWLALAGQASFARGDRFGTIRYLREAARADASELAWASITEIRKKADETLNIELDKAGVPRV